MTDRACLPGPLVPDEAYFFSGYQYAPLNHITPIAQQSAHGGEANMLLNGPSPIIVGSSGDYLISPATDTIGWDALSSTGFATIDAVVPLNTTRTETLFFNGAQYTYIVGIDPDNPSASSLVGQVGNIANFPPLHAFETLDNALPVGSTEVFFFSGTGYVRAGNIDPTAPGTAVTVYGPANVADDWSANVADDWSALVHAGFY